MSDSAIYFGFWTISNWDGRWTKAHAFRVPIASVKSENATTVCGRIPHPEFDSAIIPTVPRESDLCEQCRRIIAKQAEGLEVKKLAELRKALREGQAVRVYLAPLFGPESTAERRVGKLRVRKGQLQCQLHQDDAYYPMWWNVKVSDLWLDLETKKKGRNAHGR